MLRYGIRILILFVITIVIFLNHYSSLKGQYGGQGIIDSHRIYKYWDEVQGSSPHIEPYEPIVQGNLWSMGIGSFRISDPLAFLSAPSLLWGSILIPVVLTVIFGRFYCAWICPMALFSEFIIFFRKSLNRVGVYFFSMEVSTKLKYLILLIGVFFTLFTSVSFFYHIYPPRIISDLLRDILIGDLQLYSVIFLGVIFLIEFLFVERLWCRCLCPGGALYSLIAKWKCLKIKRNDSTCTNCKDCDTVCPYELSPSVKSLNGECDNCGLCIKSCRMKSLSYTINKNQSND